MNQNPTPANFVDELFNAAFAFRDERNGRGIFAALIGILDGANANDPVRIILQRWFVGCDAKRQADWILGTQPNTRPRRALIYSLIGATTAQVESIDTNFPAFENANILIAVEHENWYDDTIKHRVGHYGPSLISHLRASGWSPQNIGLIDQATDDILGNLADPSWGLNPANAGKFFAGRGLVVGYVQSGKTTTINLTVAKAIDVGYRLIIVLGGVTDLLRRQTQRRIDKEVVGKAALHNDPEVNEANGYRFAADWGSFIEHPEPRPGVSQRTIERLTSLSFDFARAQGAARLSDDWVNRQDSTRLVVIKKNGSRLKNLMKEIMRLGEIERKKLSVLVIDDESDQASINTINPAKVRKSDPEEKRRRAINFAIVKLLRALPRSQYVGVTATPVANCFVDPTDANDFYPRHFILPLARPDDYMGILDFHDLTKDLEPVPVGDPQPKKDMHVRNISSPRGLDDRELQRAVDSFVVAGALKLWRRKTGVYKSKHHTFFFSDSVSKDAHEGARDRLSELWNAAGYSSHAGLNRLEEVFLSDLLENSPHKGDKRYFPRTFDELRGYVSQVVQLVDEPFDGHRTVLVVNSDPDAAKIDFEVTEIWKFVVGGAKLSRGYTIEGLTTTYFRRKSANSAALMQMGRWFGYRGGYRDLVRLWISRNEPARPPFDVYEAYESICIDEEYLRRKFREWYSTVQQDGKKITPIQIRPLIELHNPRLLPVAKGQMWNAEIASCDFGGQVDDERFGTGRADLVDNEALFKALFKEHAPEFCDLYRNRKMYYSIVPAERMRHLLSRYKRPSKSEKDGEKGRLFQGFLGSTGCDLKDWVIMLPQAHGEVSTPWRIDETLAVNMIRRGWREEGYRLKPVADGKDRMVARFISGDMRGDLTPQDAQLLEACSQKVKGLAEQEKRAVMVFYPVAANGLRQGLPPIMGFELLLPPITSPRIGWRVRRPDEPDQPLVLESSA